jgi:catalase
VPLVATAAERGYVQTPRPIEGAAVRSAPASFDDHFSQAAMFYRSLTPLEQAHIVEAFTFELGKVYEQAIKERELAVLANVDTDLCQQVAAGLGLPAPKGTPVVASSLSPALSQVLDIPFPVAGRQVGIIADRGSDLAGVTKLVKALAKVGVTGLVIAPVGGVLKKGRQSVIVERTLLTTRSIEFDALVIAGGTTRTDDIKLVLLLQEAYRHSKAVAAWGDGAAILESAGIPANGVGVSVSETAAKPFTDELIAALALHRAWDRAPLVMASAVAPARKKKR